LRFIIAALRIFALPSRDFYVRASSADEFLNNTSMLLKAVVIVDILMFFRVSHRFQMTAMCY